MKKVLVSGSLAYDRIMNFPDRFSNHILPEKIHVLSLSFIVDDIQEHFGGTAGNISYNLSLLGISPVVVASAGSDFGRYKEWMQSHGIGASCLNIISGAPTASAHIFTDQSDNQITGFHMGAMRNSAYHLAEGKISEADLVCVSPGNLEDMKMMSEFSKKAGVRYIYDPGQCIPAISGDDLKSAIMGAKMLIANDYEMSVIIEKTGMREKEILEHVEILVVTLGDRGSRVETREGRREIPAARPISVSDPTGAGDAYRSGFIAGLLRGFPPDTCAKLGALVSVYTVEKKGTQTHSFTIPQLEERYYENFKEKLSYN